jgi:hypothetical protein
VASFFDEILNGKAPDGPDAFSDLVDLGKRLGDANCGRGGSNDSCEFASSRYPNLLPSTSAVNTFGEFLLGFEQPYYFTIFIRDI